MRLMTSMWVSTQDLVQVLSISASSRSCRLSQIKSCKLVISCICTPLAIEQSPLPLTLSKNITGPHRLTNLHLVTEADRSRFAKLGVVANFQMAPSSLNPSHRSSITDIIGSTRAGAMQPLLLNAVLDAGALVTLSSDWQIDALDPVF